MNQSEPTSSVSEPKAERLEVKPSAEQPRQTLNADGHQSRKGQCPWVAESNRRRAKHHLCRTPTYQAWADMRQRCRNPKNRRYADYGGRGITICERWNDFGNFLTDMGERPDDKSIGRINNDGNYEPANCRWETRIQQQRNSRRSIRIEWKGLTLTAPEWAERLNMNINAFYSRLRKNWSVERIMTYEYRRRSLLH